MTRLERLPQVAKVMKEYNIHILGLSETRWNGFGETQCDFGYSLLYSGKEEDATREYGVGMLLSRSANSSLLSWKPVSERIICARFSTRVRKVTVIQCYAPTNSASTDVKSQFYEQLGHTLKGIKKQDIVILMGDINAKMGNDNVDREYYMGQYGATLTINENGELFGDHGLVIGGTLFKHKECHKVTWISPDGKTKNQIDHVAISKTWRSSLLDVRNKRGADIDSDHHLVVAEVRLKIAVPHRKPDKAARKFNIRKLEDSNCREKFSLSLKNSFELLKEIEDEQMDETWDRIRGAYNKAAKEVLGYTNTKQEPWMSAELWAAIEKRQLLNTQILGSPSDAMLRREYSSMRLVIRKLARRDQRNAIDELADRAKLAAKR
ncbi:craniofacial development protein 2-like [Bombyx mori]|uniref:craniofacial development protein 2-like n=1 Tax=Bombyx mori TaxID=7091 RepID=UPI002ED34735